MSIATATNIWPRIIPGTCRHCGCTEGNPCPDPWIGDLDEPVGCAWADRNRTVCSVCHRLGGPPRGFPRSAREWQAAVDASEAYLERLGRRGPRARPILGDLDDDDLAEKLLDDPRALARLERALMSEELLRRGAALGFFPAPAQPVRSK